MECVHNNKSICLAAKPAGEKKGMNFHFLYSLQFTVWILTTFKDKLCICVSLTTI